MDTKPAIGEAQWDRIPADAQAALLVVFDGMAKQIADLENIVEKQQATIDELSKNSSNSSFPPSLDKPNVKRARPKKGRR